MHALTLRISHCFCVFLFSMSSIRSPCFSLRVHFHHCRDSISWISLFPCFYYLIRPLRCVGQRVVVGVDSQDAPTRIVGSCHDVMVWWSGPEQKERYGCDYVYSGQSPKRVGVVLQNRIQKKKKLKQGYKKRKKYESIQSRRVPHTESCTLAYSLSTPGSISAACPRMRHEEAPTSQKNIMNGEESQRRGRPMTKRAV